MNFDEWRKKRDGAAEKPRKTVDDIMNTHQGLCYLHVSDVALDDEDRFWLRRLAPFEEGARKLTQKASDWIAVSCFSYGGKVHTNFNANWDGIQMIDKPDPADWVRVYRLFH